MKETIYFNKAQFAQMFHALKADGCFGDDIPKEELIRIFADSVTTDTPEDEVFQTITAQGHYEGLETDVEEDDLEYIEDDFEDFNDMEDFSGYEEYDLSA